MLDFLNDIMPEYNSMIISWGEEFPAMWTFINLVTIGAV